MTTRPGTAAASCVIAFSLIAVAQRSPAGESSPVKQPAWGFFHDGLSSVAMSPDGRQVISGSHAPIIRLWNARTREQVRTFDGHEANVRGLAFSPDGKTAMSASYDKTARLWDVATGKEIRRFVGHEAELEAVAFSRDGRLAITAGQDRNLILWEVSSGRMLRRFTGHTAWVSSCVFSPDGKKVLSGSGDGTVRLWDAETAAELRVLRGHTADVCDVGYSPDGRLLASTGFDGSVKVWDSRTGKAVRTLRAAVTAELPGLEKREVPYNLAFLPDGKRLVAAMGSGRLCVWDVPTGRAVRSLFGHSSGVGYVGVSADGRRAASGGGGTLVVWDLTTWKDVHSKQIGEFEGHTEAVKCVAPSSDGTMVLSGGEDNALRLWELRTGREALCLWGHTREVAQVLFLPGGKTAVSVSPNGHRSVRVWDLEKGEQRRAAKVKLGGGPIERATAVALSPDGSRAVLAAERMSFEAGRMTSSCT
ncbi:MAG: WD40 repeat domain-containing protein, partial [Planctomycetota bacterium]